MMTLFQTISDGIHWHEVMTPLTSTISPWLSLGFVVCLEAFRQSRTCLCETRVWGGSDYAVLAHLNKGVNPHFQSWIMTVMFRFGNVVKL
eukprot:1595266-Amphidinium_carterae.1